MKLSRALMFAVAIAAVVPVVCNATLQTQHSLAAINVTINVTPAPVGMRVTQPGSVQDQRGIATHFTMHELAPNRSFSAEGITIEPNAVAQTATQQKAVKVEAEVSPNPNATLIYSPTTGVSINAVAGTTVTVPCIYNIYVNTAKTSWTVKQGLYTDLTDPSSGLSFPGGDLKNNTYYTTGTPQPAATAFAVYTTDGGQWSVMAVNGLSKAWCVDLSVTVPATTAQGNYSSNATYTIWY